MRNWNVVLLNYVGILERVFSVPMRNWNIGMKFLRLAHFHSFQRTYEELKRRYEEWRRFLGLCFQRTYEELKHRGDLDTLNKISFGFQRTYEELKHIWIAIRCCGGRSFQRTYEELKHRPCVAVVIECDWFSAYLWGIETSGRKKKMDKFLLFSAYLWGIETAVTAHGFIPENAAVFSVPMRNWNAGLVGQVVVNNQVFSVPMRNWNIRWARISCCCIQVFSVLMRNWNWSWWA